MPKKANIENGYTDSHKKPLEPAPTSRVTGFFSFKGDFFGSPRAALLELHHGTALVGLANTGGAATERRLTKNKLSKLNQKKKSHRFSL